MTTITSIETYVGPVCIVRVRTDDGLEGYGQTAHSEGELTAQVLHRLVARNYLGKDPFDVVSLADACARAEYKIWGSLVFRAMAGVDTALWDLIGKAHGQPVYQLLGGKVRDRIPVYGSAMRRDTAATEEVARITAAVERDGFRGVKVKIGERMGRDGENVLGGRTSQLVPLLRSELGDDMEISADGNGAYSAGHAIRIGRLLEEYDYFHFEEPVPFWELDATKTVTDALSIPVSSGEQEFSLENLRRLMSEHLVDIIQPDVCYVGGISRARRVADLADLAGMPCTPHSSSRSLTAIFTAHLATAMPACSGMQEWTIEDVSTMRFYDPFPTVSEGYVELTDRPGWGIDIHPAILASSVRQESRL